MVTNATKDTNAVKSSKQVHSLMATRIFAYSKAAAIDKWQCGSFFLCCFFCFAVSNLAKMYLTRAILLLSKL